MKKKSFEIQTRNAINHCTLSTRKDSNTGNNKAGFLICNKYNQNERHVKHSKHKCQSDEDTKCIKYRVRMTDDKFVSLSSALP
jgi:hypothetical protein